MRILVCGGRDFNDRSVVWRELDRCSRDFGEITIIHGGANGADAMAGEWARARGWEEKEYKANWDLWGKAAGPMRNKQMLFEGEPHMVIAFPGGAGTKNMTIQAEQAGIPVFKFDHSGNPVFP